MKKKCNNGTEKGKMLSGSRPFFRATGIHVVWVEVPETSELLTTHLDDLTTTDLQIITNTTLLGPKKNIASTGTQCLRSCIYCQMELLTDSSVFP